MHHGAASNAPVEFARAALTQSCRELTEAARRIGQDGSDPIEDVHELRIAIRRVRAVLRVFAPLFDPGRIDAATNSLRKLARVSGQARDFDVIIDRLAALASSLPVCDRPAAEGLLARLRTERHEAFGDVLDALADDGTATAELAASVTSGPRFESSLVEIDDLVAATRRQWKRLRAAACAAEDAPGDDEALHLARIRVKNLRYSLDTLAPVLDKSARDHVRALAALQDHLGAIQDAVVVERWLRSQAPRSADAFVRGELLGLERARRQHLVETWAHAWKRASRKRLCRWSRK